MPIVSKEGMERGPGGKGADCRVLLQDKRRRAAQQKILNHHETENEGIPNTEEAQCGTDRVGVADDR
jgi:hypothetical protein